MSEPFIGQIEMFGFSYAPKNWAQCNGQTLPIAQNQALFSLLGTYYGGDGVTTFKLPNLQGRIPISFDSAHSLGQVGGEEAHVLQPLEIPSHSHTLNADAVTTTGVTDTPANNLVLGRASGKSPAGTFAVNIYSSVSQPNAALAPGALGGGGNGGAHQNMMPYVVVNFCIALVGIYPSRT